MDHFRVSLLLEYESPSSMCELEARLDWTVEDLKEQIDTQITKGSLPICRMWLAIVGSSRLDLQDPEKKLWEVEGLRNSVVAVQRERTKHPPNGALMWSKGLVGSPTACLKDTAVFSPEQSVPVVRCRPFCVESLTATPFVVEIDARGVETSQIPYADAYINAAHVSIVEFGHPPRFDSRFGTQAGMPTGGWREVLSAKVHAR